MNNSGIIRRVDELGRIVIPVELRKYLNIKEGENLEFSIKDESIILNKKSIIKQNSNILNNIEKSISGIIDGDYIITDREKVLYSSDKSLIDKKLENDLLNYLALKEEYVLSNDNSLIKGKDTYIFTYHYENNIMGFIILYNINDLNKYLKLVKFICSYINDSLSIS